MWSLVSARRAYRRPASTPRQQRRLNHVTIGEQSGGQRRKRRGETLYVGGAFTRIGGAERKGIAALSTATARATKWHPRLRLEVGPLENAQPWVSGVIAASSRVFVSGHFDTVDGRRVRALAAIDPASGRLLPWRPVSLAFPPGTQPCTRYEESVSRVSTALTLTYIVEALG
jgi:hypothetical protein